MEIYGKQRCEETEYVEKNEREERDTEENKKKKGERGGSVRGEWRYTENKGVRRENA